MSKILIHNVSLNGIASDILIEGARIASVTPTGTTSPYHDITIDGTGKAAFPGLVNCHTHAAMSLFRGYGDDLPLQKWLTTKIWPNEAHLDEDIIYWGTRLACLEMIKSGTTCFNDMYFFPRQVARAVLDSGLRAVVGTTTIGNDMDAIRSAHASLERDILDFQSPSPEGDTPISFAVAPHAIYTVGPDTLQWIHHFALEHDLLYHIHVSETLTEVDDAKRLYGLSPVQHLAKLGVLSSTTIAAHCVWLSPDDIRLLGQHDVRIVHNPNSNLKLGSGHEFKYKELSNAGSIVTLGTDGCSSSNNLDMIEAAKVASLLQKGWRRDTTILPVSETFQMASLNGARALRIDAGEIAPGRLADLFLVNLDNLAFVPNNDTLSNLIYAAHGDCVDTLICGGRILMRHRQVADEQEIIRQARRVVQRLITI